MIHIFDPEVMRGDFAVRHSTDGVAKTWCNEAALQVFTRTIESKDREIAELRKEVEFYKGRFERMNLDQEVKTNNHRGHNEA